MGFLKEVIHKQRMIKRTVWKEEREDYCGMVTTCFSCLKVANQLTLR